MLGQRPYIQRAARLVDWNAVCSATRDVSHRGRFFRELVNFHAATSRECSKFAQSLLGKVHFLDQSKIQRLRAHTSESGSAIATLASMNPKHPIVQLRPIIIRIGLLQYFPQSSIPSQYNFNQLCTRFFPAF
jgi:hypothetical protein